MKGETGFQVMEWGSERREGRANAGLGIQPARWNERRGVRLVGELRGEGSMLVMRLASVYQLAFLVK